MKPAEREAALRRERDLAELALKRQRRENRLIIVRAVAGMIGFAAGFPLVRALLRHEPFDMATMGLCALSYSAVTALIWGAYFAWERRRRS